MDYSNYIVNGLFPNDLNHYQKKRFLFDMKKYFLDEPYLSREYVDEMIRRYVKSQKGRPFLRLATYLNLVDIIVVQERLQKCINMDTIGLLSIEMIMSWSKCILNIKYKGNFKDFMRCL